MVSGCKLRNCVENTPPAVFHEFSGFPMIFVGLSPFLRTCSTVYVDGKSRLVQLH